MNRRTLVVRCGVGLASLAGCARGNRSGRSATDGPARTSTVRGDAERRARSHAFVHVDPVGNRSVVDPDEAVAFEDLSERRKRTFRRALDAQRVAADGWGFYDESRPRYVRYDGTWFRVIVAVH